MTLQNGTEYRGLLGVLEWLLPEPLTPDQVLIHEQTPREASGHHAQLIVRPRRSATVPSVGSFEAFPDPRAPRLLFPAGRSIRHFSPLLRPRSQSLGKTLASKLLRNLPFIIDGRVSRVVLETERRSTLAESWHGLVDPARTAMHVGYRNGHPRPTLWGFDDNGSLSTIGKYASGAAGRQALEKEQVALSAVRQFDSLKEHVPCTFGVSHGHLGALLLTDAFNGDPGPLDVDARIRAWLERCVLESRIPAARSSLFQALDEAVLHLGGNARAAYRAGMYLLSDAMVPETVVHGDFAPWNLLVDSTRIHVFDWEEAVLDGVPEWDRLHYTLRVGLNIRRWTGTTLARTACKLGDRGSTWFAPHHWRAMIALSLVNLRGREAQAGKSTRIMSAIDEALASLLQRGWLSHADDRRFEGRNNEMHAAPELHQG